ncbi:hypothetical protein B0H15DRAFT_91323 [Mycena belliarum]|uniref:AMP-activated protein kinase glycogen-binding domain-containing protein n=1 Tax=Mycena belliarum TaxID=1033014 RepID=A0AAD6XTP4_9AGAR|nr:hypothetical protein B0H15DRAFT_91323 [Mycena belliae]
MHDLHEVHFTWPSAHPSVVVVTGTFDEWTASVHLVKSESGFHGSTLIPWDSKILFKYIVDSNWVCESTSPTETDASGNVNNVYTSPPRPLVEAVESAPSDATVASSSTAIAATEKPDAPAPVVTEAKNENMTAGDLVNTVAARDGTSSAFEYVASALGATMQSQIGVDPINGEKVAVETPKPDAQFSIPEPPAPETSPAAPPPMASVVPIEIVPVNAEENNTTSSGTSPEVAPVVPYVPISEAPSRMAPEPETLETSSTHAPASEPGVDSLETATAPHIASEPIVSGTLTHSEPPASLDAGAQGSETSTLPVAAQTEKSSTASTSALAADPAPTKAAITQPEERSTNGVAPSIPVVSPPPTTSAAAPAQGAPATPSKSAQHAFPSSETDSMSSNTNSPAKFGTVDTIGSRKNRKSIFGKFKGLFSGDKEEKEKKK